MKIVAMIAVLLIGSTSGILGQVSPDTLASRVSISPINDHLFLIKCIGGEEFNMAPFAANLIASIGPDGVLLVDAGFNATGKKLHDTLKAIAKGSGNRKIMINTHFHNDHTNGNQFLKDEWILMISQAGLNSLSGKYFNLPGVPDPNCPQIGFADSMTMHFNNENIYIIPAPRTHSGGDVYVYFENSKVVAAGDLFFSDELPYVELPSGSVAGYHAQIKKFISDFPDDITFYPGHGRSYTKKDLYRYDTMLTETVRIIREAAEQKQNVETMIQNNILADWASWRGQFPTTTLEAWIRTVYWDITHPHAVPPSICEPLTSVLVKRSASDAVKEYYALKAARGNDFDFSEAHLNMLGYQLMARNRVDDAYEIFKLNLTVFPNSGNVYDSFGEILLVKGDTAQAIANYKKSLEHDPTNNNAVEVLKRINVSK